MDQKYLESRFIIFCSSRGFQKGIIYISFDDRIKTTSKIVDSGPEILMHGHKNGQNDRVMDRWTDKITGRQKNGQTKSLLL